MGDVFIILALTQFGPGPALIMYWLDMLVAAGANVVKKYGLRSFSKIKPHKLLFNLACCSFSVGSMALAYRLSMTSRVSYPTNFVAGLAAVAIVWFFVNTVTLSVAIALWSGQKFWVVWREGVGLALLNFLASAAGAGLISLLYRKTEFSVFLLSLPLAVILYQLYNFYIQKYEQAREHIGELNKLYLQTVESLASAVDAKDRYTHGHIRRVQAYAVELAILCGIVDEKELLAIKAGALLHDIGKIAIPEYILNKPTVLTETEYEKMKIHPVVGARMLSTIEFPFPLVPIVKFHHERWDGKGYPDGLAGEQIPLSARILSLVDCYDALTTNRPYRAPMDRDKVIDLFRKESGRAYDPAVVETFIQHIEQIEDAGRAVVVERTDVWGIKEVETSTSSMRPLERVQPVVTYSKALNADPFIQRELYSVFEFARADFHCLNPTEIFSFMGRRLSNLIGFDTAVFYAADLENGRVRATHAIGEHAEFFKDLSLPLEQKLTGWVAANNQSLCNLPPFPDFLNFPEPKPAFQISAIVPINHQNKILGAISLYRTEIAKFTEQEFRRLEIIASQVAVTLARCNETVENIDSLTDETTGLPNSLQLYLMFDSVAVDASRYAYPLTVLSIHVEELPAIRKQWGHFSGDEAIRATANYIRKELRETDLLVRFAVDEFVAITPKMSTVQAENLKSRLQNDLDRFNFAVRAQTKISLRVAIGISEFPQDGTDVQSLVNLAASRANEDRELRAAVKNRIRRVLGSAE
ncbi:MAG TPA: HD domain-containing phosphohydrolase [Terriglobia bacterium]|nr:HD domain-containing phosphohydrolase [Terriglobia bacterium]